MPSQDVQPKAGFHLFRLGIWLLHEQQSIYLQVWSKQRTKIENTYVLQDRHANILDVHTRTCVLQHS